MHLLRLWQVHRLLLFVFHDGQVSIAAHAGAVFFQGWLLIIFRACAGEGCFGNTLCEGALVFQLGLIFCRAVSLSDFLPTEGQGRNLERGANPRRGFLEEVPGTFEYVIYKNSPMGWPHVLCHQVLRWITTDNRLLRTDGCIEGGSQQASLKSWSSPSTLPRQDLSFALICCVLHALWPGFSV
ncbi:hypothetical protein LEMLEM_LOCUS16773 [Lemmus lemmus]